MKSNNFNPAIPAALIPFVAPMASFAAEGTSLVSSGEGTLRSETVANKGLMSYGSDRQPTNLSTRARLIKGMSKQH